MARQLALVILVAALIAYSTFASIRWYEAVNVKVDNSLQDEQLDVFKIQKHNDSIQIIFLKTELLKQKAMDKRSESSIIYIKKEVRKQVDSIRRIDNSGNLNFIRQWINEGTFISE